MVGNCSKTVKDCYVVPLAADDALDACLLPLDGPGLEDSKPDLLLALIVRSRRKRPGDDVYQTPAAAPVPPEQEYDPASAGKDLVEDEEDEEEVYDPERAFPDEKPAPVKKKIRVEIVDKNEPQFSDDDNEKDKSSGGGPITSSGGGFTEQLAKLTKEIEEQKAEIQNLRQAEPSSNIPGFQNLPTGIASILFGGDSAPPSTQPKSSLSSMSDAELLAKAAAQAPEAPPQAPQYPPMMPNNQYGQPPPQAPPHEEWSQQQDYQPDPWMRGYEPQPQPDWRDDDKRSYRDFRQRDWQPQPPWHERDADYRDNRRRDHRKYSRDRRRDRRHDDGRDRDYRRYRSRSRSPTRRTKSPERPPDSGASKWKPVTAVARDSEDPRNEDGADNR